MPTILRWKGWKFLFYSLDRDEPPHIHARKDRKEVKIWLDDLSMARNRRCTAKEIRDIISVTKEHRTEFLEKWNEHFGN